MVLVTICCEAIIYRTSYSINLNAATQGANDLMFGDGGEDKLFGGGGDDEIGVARTQTTSTAKEASTLSTVEAASIFSLFRQWIHCSWAMTSSMDISETLPPGDSVDDATDILMINGSDNNDTIALSQEIAPSKRITH